MVSDVVSRLRARKGFLGAKEVAELLGLKAVTVYKLGRNGTLPCFRLATAVRFDPGQLATWLEAHAVAAVR